MILETCVETLSSLHLENVNISLQSIELIYKALYPRRRDGVLQHLFLKGCGLGSEDEIPGYAAWASEDDEPQENDDSDEDYYSRQERLQKERAQRVWTITSSFRKLSVLWLLRFLNDVEISRIMNMTRLLTT